MASPAQTLANQANAQHSTGPKTGAGKARAAKNATTHGLAAGVLHVADADREAFRQFEANLRQAVLPHGALETETCNQLLFAAWRLRQLHLLVRKLYQEHGADPFIVPDAAAEVRQLTRYRAALEMTFFRATKQLRELQTRRAARDLQLHEPEQDFLPGQLNPSLYARAIHTRGSRELLLFGSGFLGAHVSGRVSLDENFLPTLVLEPVPMRE